MTVVFVHGNPEVAAIWGPLLAELGRDDAVTLSPPGFGAPVPDGFGATSDEYRDWLIGELEGMEGPIDLVGHDWGGGHVQRVAAARPDLIRSWCSDIAGAADPEYVWHDMAQVWQTPGDGEAFVEVMNGMPLADRVATFTGLGMTEEAATACAEAGGPEMGSLHPRPLPVGGAAEDDRVGRRAGAGRTAPGAGDHRHRGPLRRR